MNKKQTNRRYRLHQHLRKKGIKCSPFAKTIFVVSGTNLDKYSQELHQNHKYSIQYVID